MYVVGSGRRIDDSLGDDNIPKNENGELDPIVLMNSNSIISKISEKQIDKIFIDSTYVRPYLKN